jgi:hypothetical protein
VDVARPLGGRCVAMGIQQRFPKSKVGGSTPLGTAMSLVQPFVFSELAACLCDGAAMFVTSVFLLWPRSFAIPESARRFRSVSTVYRWASESV